MNNKYTEFKVTLHLRRKKKQMGSGDKMLYDVFYVGEDIGVGGKKTLRGNESKHIFI